MGGGGLLYNKKELRDRITKCSTVDPWKTWVCTAWICILWTFFNKYTVGSSYTRGFTSCIQPIADWKQHFRCTVRNPWMWRADCGLFCAVLYKEPIRHRYQWMAIVKFWGSQKFIWGNWVSTDFSTVRGMNTPNPHVVQGSTVYGLCLHID